MSRTYAGLFGWSYPAGAANDPNAPYNQDEGDLAVWIVRISLLAPGGINYIYVGPFDDQLEADDWATKHLQSGEIFTIERVETPDDYFALRRAAENLRDALK